MADNNKLKSRQQGTGKPAAIDRVAWHSTLRFQFVSLIVLATFLAGGVVGLVLTRVSRDSIRQEVLHANLEQAGLAAELASTYMTAIQAHARVFALRPDVREAVSNNRTAQAQIAVTQFVEIQDVLNGVGICDADGIQLLNSDLNSTTVGQSFADRDWFQQAVATKQPYLDVPSLPKSNGKAVSVYAVPILDEQGQIRAVLTCGISLEKLSDAILSINYGTDARASLMDSRNGGVIIAHTDPKRIMTQVSGTNEAAKRVLAGERGAIETTSSTGEMDIVGFAPVQNLPWGIMVLKPSRTALAAITVSTRNAILFTVAIILFAAMLGLVLVIRVTRPLRRLVEGIREVGGGNLDYSFPAVERNEIGVVSGAFDHMLQNLKTTLVSRDKLAAEVTERKRAEVLLTKTEARYRDLYENAPVAYYSVGADALIRESNKATQVWLGYPAKELAGKNRSEIYAPESKAKAELLFQKATNGCAVEDEEMVYLKKNGDRVAGLLSATLIFGEQGQVTATRSVVVDITQRLEAETKAMQLAEQWRTTFDSIADMISIVNRDYRIVRVNRAFAEFFKSAPGPLEGSLIHELIHGTREPLADCPVRQTFATGRPALVEMFAQHIGIWVAISSSPIIDVNGNVSGAVHIIRDISGLKKAQEQLMAQDRLASIGELTSGIAHEINNPLTSVLGFSEMLLERKDLPEDVRADLEIVHKSALRTTAIVKNLLAFARKRPEKKQPIDLEKDVRTILELRAYEEKVNNIQVHVHFPSDLPRVIGSSFQFQQVFLNIIVNAEYFMKAAHRGGNLTISAECVGDFVRISFADDGPGIPKENLARIFNPFFTTKDVGQGTGLGLSICHGIITEHGGRIYAESEPGQGARMIIELPVKPAPDMS